MRTPCRRGKSGWFSHFGVLLTSLVLLAACSTDGDHPELNASAEVNNVASPLYRIGPGDNVRIFVWRNAELSNSVPVRPDGKITTPLVEDLQAVSKTPTELARDVEEVLSTYVKAPVVTIIVTGFSGPFSDQIRVLGEGLATPCAELSGRHDTARSDDPCRWSDCVRGRQQCRAGPP